MMNLPNIPMQPKTGTEFFCDDGQELGFDVLEFWSWNQSQLLENRTRGILAEFLVKKALGIQTKHRVEWDNYDLVTPKGLTFEVKSAAYIQSWEQSKFSKISFGIAPTVGAKDHQEYDGQKRRWTDYYVFCLLKHQDQDTINPLDVSQWTFYILKTSVLDALRPEQKHISLNALLTLQPNVCSFHDLKRVIEEN